MALQSIGAEIFVLLGRNIQIVVCLMVDDHKKSTWSKVQRKAFSLKFLLIYQLKILFYIFDFIFYFCFSFFFHIIYFLNQCATVFHGPCDHGFYDRF